MDQIIIQNAREGNLKNLTLSIPRGKLVAVTGPSGSGKSTLAVDVLFRESQRQYLEAMGMQGIRKPNVESVLNASPALLINQSSVGRNPRSTVGTVTDIYTNLRMLFEKLHLRTCPHCGGEISSAHCREETERIDGDFKVYMICNLCGHRMDKLTRTHFSHNTHEGACLTCQGLGKTLAVNPETILKSKLTLAEGAIACWETGKYGEFLFDSYRHCLQHYGLEDVTDRPVADYPELHRRLLLEGVECEELQKRFPEVSPPKTVTGGRFEGVYPSLWRKLSDKGGLTGALVPYFTHDTCPDCKGDRLSALSRSATVGGRAISELSKFSLDDLCAWLSDLEAHLGTPQQETAEIYLLDLHTKLTRLSRVGLGYLTPDRQTMTLSGGESQRMKLATALDSSLAGLLYVLDEPTAGLHAKDTAGLMEILLGLRGKGNTVILIEHDPDVIRMADHIIDLGPAAGQYGGELVAQGTPHELEHAPRSLTGTWLHQSPLPPQVRRKPSGWIQVMHAHKNNLLDFNAAFPVGCLVGVCGVSGSGKSTLVFDVLAKRQTQGDYNTVLGLEQFDNVITVEQTPLSRMSRSNVATYSGVYSELRKLFGSLPASQELGLTPSSFSFNSKGGRCETCGGLGTVESNLLFFESVEVPCPTCCGKRFDETVLSVTHRGHNIRELLDTSVEETLAIYRDIPALARYLSLLNNVGLGYLIMGQSLSTLSGGEAQRLKLARELLSGDGNHSLYLIDEPTTGLHPSDVAHFATLLHHLILAGNTVLVVEHNLQLLSACDYLLELGPGGGAEGGQILVAGTPEELAATPHSITGQYFRFQSV